MVHFTKQNIYFICKHGLLLDAKKSPGVFSLLNRLTNNGQQTYRCIHLETTSVKNVSILILKIDILKPLATKTKSPRFFRGLFRFNNILCKTRGEWI